MKTVEEAMKAAGELANETLDRAEEKGLTLAEILQVPKVMENIIRNELQRSGKPYKREKPRI